MRVVVVTIKSDRRFDDNEYSHLPLMNEVFGVYSSLEKAQAAVSEHFCNDKYDCLCWDKNTAYFSYRDGNYGGIAYYEATYHYKEVK